MPRITKVYTRTGDDGSTGLGTGRRVKKTSPRIVAFGTVDELSSFIGLALAGGLCDELRRELPVIQNELFHLGSDLCVPDEPGAPTVPRIESRHVERLEGLIDRLNDELEPLANFVLPGGSPGAARLHVARTVCRRAERKLIELSESEAIGDETMRYLNRLSDALFVMARFENKAAGIEDVLWDSRA